MVWYVTEMNKSELRDKRQRHRETERETHRETETQRDRDRETHRDRERPGCSEQTVIGQLDTSRK